MQTTQEQIASAVDITRKAATATLSSAKAALKAYQAAIDLALATTREYDQDLANSKREAQEGLDNIYDALSAVRRYPTA